jgi:hypothetical protein
VTDAEFAEVIYNNHELLRKATCGQYVESQENPEDPTSHGHCAWMLEEALRFHREGKTDKANRWLGFVQAVLAMAKVPLDDLKKANTV